MTPEIKDDMEDSEPQAAFICKKCGEAIPESEIDSHECQSEICKFCNLSVSLKFADRHRAIHNVALKFTDKEIQANIVITLTEIKNTLDKLYTTKQIERAEKRSR